MRLIEGNWMNGMTPMTLLNRMSVNSVMRSGRNCLKSLLPITSRAMELRTKP